MRIANRRYFLLSLLLAVAILLLDQASKWLVLKMFVPLNRPPIGITSFFDLALVWNTGISFGMFAGHRKPFLLVALSLAITLILLIWLYKNSSGLVACALGL